MERDYNAVKHPIPPVYDSRSKVLVLGSFPSVRSREQGFFYGHPQNRFWRVLSAIAGKEEPESIADKRELLLSMGVAVWDVLAGCEIVGSSDSSIRNAVPNDIGRILKEADIRRIFLNGKTALKYYDKFIKPTLGIEAVALPSTSPANAAWSIERLIESWKIITEV